MRQRVVETLRQNGYVIEVAATFAQAYEKIKLYRYSCVLVDLTLPDGDGLDDRVRGLDLGSDDYLLKPFHLPGPNARLRAIIRLRQFQGQHYLVFRDLLVWPKQAGVLVKGELPSLTRKEYGPLLHLLANPGRVLTKETIAGHLCGDQVDATDSFDFIDTYLKNLRKKLQERGADNYTRPRYGVGYKLSTE